MEKTNEAGKLQRSGFTTLHLFSGAGGGILADLLLDHRPICAVEIEPYCRQVLYKRQQDGILPWFPVFKDARKFDGKPWQGICSCVCAGFPCQDISSAGKGLGIGSGKRSGLWSEVARVIGEVKPVFAFIENSPLLVSRGLDIVLTDLADLGYSARWGVLGAWHVGGNHERERIWILAYSNEKRRPLRRDDAQPVEGGKRLSGQDEQVAEKTKRRSLRVSRPSETYQVSDSRKVERVAGGRRKRASSFEVDVSGASRTRIPESRLDGSIDGVDSWLDQLEAFGWSWRDGTWEEGIPRTKDKSKWTKKRIEAIGNGQVPLCAALAFKLLSIGLIGDNL